MEYLVLSRRNLKVLLSKLDRAKAGDATECILIKTVDSAAPDWLQNSTEIMIKAVEDEVLYAAREPGPVHPLDEAKAINSVFTELL